MAQKNKYLFRSRISERTFRGLLRMFAIDITADRAGALAGVNHKTAADIYRLLRLRMAELAQVGCPFRGVVEVDESYFGPTAPVATRGAETRARSRSSASSSAAGGCIARS